MANIEYIEKSDSNLDLFSSVAQPFKIRLFEPGEQEENDAPSRCLAADSTGLERYEITGYFGKWRMDGDWEAWPAARSRKWETST